MDIEGGKLTGIYLQKVPRSMCLKSHFACWKIYTDIINIQMNVQPSKREHDNSPFQDKRCEKGNLLLFEMLHFSETKILFCVQSLA